MVTFRLIEETDQYLTYWYFPNGNEDEMYGIILIDKLNETVEIQKMAHDDFSHIVTVDEQNELRNSINEMRKEEGLPLLTEEEWKLRAMGTTIGCHTIVKKGTEGNEIKTYDLT